MKDAVKSEGNSRRAVEAGFEMSRDGLPTGEGTAAFKNEGSKPK